MATGGGELPEYTGDDWIIVPNWDRFQHYSDRNPPWIKVYMSLLSNAEFLDLSMPARGLLVTIWLAYARNSGQLRVKVVRKFCRSTRGFMHKSQLDSLLSVGLLEISASKPLAPKKEKEVEKEQPQTPSRENVTNPGHKRAHQREMHEALLAAASDAVADWQGGTSETVDDLLDALERRYRSTLTRSERERLWDVAAKRCANPEHVKGLIGEWLTRRDSHLGEPKH